MEARTTKRAVAAVAFAATLTGGAVVGAMLGTPTTSGAQSATSEPTTTSAPATTDPGAGKDDPGRPDGPFGHGHGFGFGAFDLSAAAKALGITEDDLKSRLAKGDTLAEIAKAEGVAEDDLIAALVKAGTEAIDQAAADAKAGLEDRITDFVEKGLPDRPEGGFGHGPGFGAFDLSAAAKALGITEDDLESRLEKGDTLAEIAKAEGVDVDAVVSALVAEANQHIDQAVKDGKLDADRSAELKAGLEARIRSFVEDGARGPFGHPHR